MTTNVFMALLLGVCVCQAVEIPDELELSKTADCPWFSIMEMPKDQREEVLAAVAKGDAEFLGGDGEYAYVALSGKWGAIGEKVYYFTQDNPTIELFRAKMREAEAVRAINIKADPHKNPPPLKSISLPTQYVLWYYSRKSKLHR